MHLFLYPICLNYWDIVGISPVYLVSPPSDLQINQSISRSVNQSHNNNNNNNNIHTRCKVNVNQMSSKLIGVNRRRYTYTYTVTGQKSSAPYFPVAIQICMGICIATRPPPRPWNNFRTQWLINLEKIYVEVQISLCLPM